MKFRWLERKDHYIYQTHYYDCVDWVAVRVLQQWWEDETAPRSQPEVETGEWRDVPIDIET